MDDYDAGGFTHWIAWNISPSNIIEWISKWGSFKEWINDFGSTWYWWPCPSEWEPHNYNFKIYALNNELELVDWAGRLELEELIEANKIWDWVLNWKFSR